MVYFYDLIYQNEKVLIINISEKKSLRKAHQSNVVFSLSLLNTDQLMQKLTNGDNAVADPETSERGGQET